MVTLQILVLSFLVRIQVAQLKTTFARKSFFFVKCLHEAAGARHCCVVHGLLMQASHPRTPHHCMSSPHANELRISWSSCSS